MSKWKSKQPDSGNPAESQKEREERAFDLFADMIIEKIRSVKSDWKKPWFTEGQLAWPKALYGKSYHGMNALMLTLLCENEGWKIPVFATRDRVFGMNFQKDGDGKNVPAIDGDGQKLPFVHILKGSHSFPVFLSKVNIVHNETKEKIKWDDYVKLDSHEKEEYTVYRNRYLHYVFNVDQTNLKEARPELYAKLEEENVPKKLESDGPVFDFEPLDSLVAEQRWICPIEPTYQDDAYYSISKNKIVIPEKEQFIATGKPEAYYGTMLHEMAHSTGAEQHLDRLKPTNEKNAYAREELVAELSAALCCHRYGIGKVIKEGSVPYLQNWLDALHESPDFIKTVLKDVNQATSFIDIRIEAIRQEKLGESEELVTDHETDVSSTVGEGIDAGGQEQTADAKEVVEEQPERRNGIRM